MYYRTNQIPMSFANNAISIKPNFMLSAFNKWSFDSDNSLLKINMRYDP